MLLVEMTKKLVMMVLVGKQLMKMKWMYLIALKRFISPITKFIIHVLVLFLLFSLSLLHVRDIQLFHLQEVDPDNPSDNNTSKDKSTATSQEDNTGGRSGPLAVPLAALGYVTKFATGLFTRAKKQLDSSDSAQSGTSEADHKAELDTFETTLDEDDESKGFYVPDGLEQDSVHQLAEVENPEAKTEVAKVKMEDKLDKSKSFGLNNHSKASSTMDDPCNFKHFDVAENPLDHHFLVDAETVIYHCFLAVLCLFHAKFWCISSLHPFS